MSSGPVCEEVYCESLVDSQAIHVDYQRLTRKRRFYRVQREMGILEVRDGRHWSSVHDWNGETSLTSW